LPPQAYHAERVLGIGGQGKVYAACRVLEDALQTSVNANLISSAKVALKMYDSKVEQALKGAAREFKVLSLVRDHPHFVKVHDFSSGNGIIRVPKSLPQCPDDHMAPYRSGLTVIDDATCMSMDLSVNGDLFDIVKSTGGFRDVSLVRYLFNQILDAMSHLNKVGYSHLDLKLDNVLIGNDFKLKLCDLGFARKVQKQLSQKYGTESYMAPEVIMKERYDTYEGV
jgi:serine/threonine protein kinase